MGIDTILRYKNVAVVGCSRNEEKDAHRIPKYLQEHGYRVIPVNPFADEILGERCYPSLLEMPEDLQKRVEVVNVFRPSEDVPPIVEQAIQLKEKHGALKAVWMQLGIWDEEAARAAKEVGLEVVMDSCIKTEHMRRSRSLP